MCTHLGELCVYFAVSAEYAMRAHVTVLAWDGRSYFGTVYKKQKHIYMNTCMVVSSEIIRPGCALAAAATCPWLFCISSDQCIGGMSEVSVSRHRGVLEVFLGL